MLLAALTGRLEWCRIPTTCFDGLDPDRSSFLFSRGNSTIGLENPGTEVEVGGPKRAGFAGRLEDVSPLLPRVIFRCVD